MAYIITVRKKSDESNSLVKNLVVTDSLHKAVAYVIRLRGERNPLFDNGILKFQSPDALDAYGPGEIKSPVLLFSSDFYRAYAENIVIL
ncbi:MAG: hypothetical protein U0T74_01225 [Chitinophagales bacterium]